MLRRVGQFGLGIAAAIACALSAAQDVLGPPPTPDAHACVECQTQEDWNAAVAASEHPWLLRTEDFLSRRSDTHGRAIGHGEPLRGTSWLNRPYAVSYQVGALVMTGNPAPGVDPDNDLFAALHLGRDFDHYWGVEFRLGLATPELNDNAATVGQRSADTFTLADLSVLYYPWGDSRVRPFLRLGAGLTDVEFTTPAGVRTQESPFTIPLGVGVKYLSWRATAWRAELVNNFTLDGPSTNATDNITLTFGLEHRFGGSPEGYWAWRPRGRFR